MGDLSLMKRFAAALCAFVLLLVSSAFVLPVSAASAKNIDYVEAQYFTSAPTIDGYISEAEWGEYTVMVEATDCETKDGSSPWKFFLYWRTGDKNDYSSWYYYLWLRWDENYFYIGLKNYDPDIHSLKNGTTNTWDGDALQTRIDPMGPNAAVQGQEFTVTGDLKKPWSGEKTVPDFLFGYVEIAGGFSEAWENSANKGMTSFSDNALGVSKTVVAPAGSDYSTDTKAGITTYEIAIPWAYMKLTDRRQRPVTELTYEEYSYLSKPKGGIGREFGMSVAVLDDGNNGDPKWDAFMTWGSGICNAQQEEGAKTCTGSNSVTLSDKKFTPQSGYKTYDPSSLLDAKFGTSGYDTPGTYYDYLAGDTYKETRLDYAGLSALTYDDESDKSVWGSRQTGGNAGRITDIGAPHGNVLEYAAGDPLPQNTLETIDDSSGAVYRYPTSFTFEFDIQYTGTELFENNYASALFNWFGGTSGRAFRCGYFFNDGMFEIVNDIGADGAAPTMLAFCKYDLELGNWYRWRFQFDNESCTARFWIDDLSTDDDNSGGSEWGKMIFNVCNRYFYYSDPTMRENGAVLTFRRMNVQCMFDNVRIYNFASYKNIARPDETTGATDGAREEQGGGDLTLDGAYRRDGTWHIPIRFKEEYRDALKLSFEIRFDPASANFAGITPTDGKNGTVEAVREADGVYVITVTDTGKYKDMRSGDVMFEILLRERTEGTDINSIVKSLTDSYLRSVGTGDSSAAVCAAFAVSLAVCAAVIYRRRRKRV